MPAISITAFSGLVPRTGPTLLANEQAQIAKNVKLQSGELRPWRKPVLEYDPVNNPVSIYKLVKKSDGSSKWLTFTTDTDVVAGPLADLADDRVYYTNGVLPKKTNWALATTGAAPYPVAALNLKVPAPAAAPTLSASGGSGGTETRSYVYTFVSTFGAVKEESAPSPAALVTCNVTGMTVNVSGFSTAGTTAQGYNITHIRIYRSLTGTTSLAYVMVDEIAVTPSTGVVVASQTSTYGKAVAASTYPDTFTNSQLSAIALPSLTWSTPPDDLKGLVSMPNGMMAGFRNNEVYFCEPYYPHAWPANYMLTTEFPIVGLGVFGSTLVVTTTKNPYLISGTHPSAMTQEKLALLQPCVSKRSIAYDQYGVLYASPNGIVTISPGTQEVITTSLYTRDEWQAITPSSMHGLIYNNYYLGFYKVGDTYGCVVMARGDQPPLTNFDFDATCVFLEHSTAKIYAVSAADNSIYQLDAHTTDNTVYEWKSKQYIMPRPVSFAALQANADFSYLGDAATINAARAAVAAANLALWNNANANSISLQGDLNARNQVGVGKQLNDLMVNGSVLAEIPDAADGRYITIQIFADGTLVHSTGVESLEPVRLPAQKKAYRWEIYITGNAPLREVVMATSIQELAGV